MFEDKGAIDILKDDHKNVKTLFDRFEEAESQDEREQIAAAVIEELKTHTVIEEEIFYPAVREAADSDIMNEADEEHHVAKVLIAELEDMDSSDEHYAAKFHVLAESVRHHIKEEESKMFPEAKDAGLDMDALGHELLERKQELKEEGFPQSPEEKMVGHAGTAVASSSRSRRSPKRAAHRAQPHHYKDGHDSTAGKGART